MEGRVVGRGCLALLFHVVSTGRALPLAWRGRQRPQGPCPAALPIAMVDLRSAVIPTGAKGVVLGDGEFEGTALQDRLRHRGWSYVCRTALSTTATWEGETFRLERCGTCLRPGRLMALHEVSVTREAYGPIMVVWCWAKEYQEPLSLVSNLATAEEACCW
jgi:hypothetical protein